MMRLERLGMLASALTLTLACGPTAWAEAQATSEAPGDPTQTVAPAKADPGAASRARIEQRRAEAMAERERRYEALRADAAEVGIDLPETPPWAQGMPQPPHMPDVPEMPGMGAPPLTQTEWNEQREERWAALRERAAEKDIALPEKPIWQLTSTEERQAYAETMRQLTPEQRRTLHGLRWEAMRAQAAERGMALPESPPWEQMMKEREAMQARWQGYRETVEAMTPEQREAAAAIYGAPFGPHGGHSCGGGPSDYRYPPMLPPYGNPAYDQGMGPLPPSALQGPTPPYGSGY